MEAATAGLIGAAIGGGVAILKSVIDGRNQRKLEKLKKEWTEGYARNTEIRDHVATVAQDLLAAQHSIEWVCALTDGKQILTAENVDSYHKEIHTAFPKLLGSLAMLSSVDQNAYAELSNLAEKVFYIDRQIALALRNYNDDPVSSSAQVALHRDKATELYKELPLTIGQFMKEHQPNRETIRAREEA